MEKFWKSLFLSNRSCKPSKKKKKQLSVIDSSVYKLKLLATAFHRAQVFRAINKWVYHRFGPTTLSIGNHCSQKRLIDSEPVLPLGDTDEYGTWSVRPGGDTRVGQGCIFQVEEGRKKKQKNQPGLSSWQVKGGRLPKQLLPKNHQGKYFQADYPQNQKVFPKIQKCKRHAGKGITAYPTFRLTLMPVLVLEECVGSTE